MALRLLFFLLLLPFSNSLFGQGNLTFHVAYPSQATSSSILRLPDGYLIASYTQTQVILLKTDFSGLQQWQTIVDANMELKSLTPTTDGGFILGGSVNNTGALLLKVNAAGSQQWAKSFAWAGSMATQTFDGGYAFVTNKSTMQYFPSGNSFPDSSMLHRTDQNGNVLWSLGFKDFQIRGLNQTMDKGLLLFGSTRVANTIPAKSVKLNEAGQLQWEKNYPLQSSINLVQQLADSSFVMSGLFPYQTHLLRTSSTGDTLWTRKVTSGGYFQRQSGLQTLANGDFVFSTHTDGTPGSSAQYVSLARFSATGQQICYQRFGNGLHTPQYPSDTVHKSVAIFSAQEGNNLATHPDGGFVMIAKVDSFVYYPPASINSQLMLMKFDNSCNFITAIPVDLQASNKLQVFPNPSTGNFNLVDITASSKPAQIVIFNLNGKEVYRKPVVALSGNAPFKVDLTHQPKGVYLLQVITASEVKTTRLVIQ